MSKKYFHHFKEVSFIFVLWITMTLLYIFIKFNDIPDHYLQEMYGMDPNVSKSWIIHVSLYVGAPVGIFFGLLYSFFYPWLYRTKGFLTNIIIRLMVFGFITGTVFIILLEFSDFEALLSRNTSGIFTYMLFTEMLIGLGVLIRRNLGGDYLINTILNTYRHSKEEQRAFLFLDMVDSTSTEENMGHLKFSRYIQDCFYDLSDVVLDHGGRIYQFVGDEAVITWKVSEKFEYEQCIDLYFDYMNCLGKKADHYLDLYGHIPIFKCAIHYGSVSTALVGDYKKEITYHGNVLNLCSRLQAYCKEKDSFVIISDNLYRSVVINNRYEFNSVTILGMKGISGEQKAYYITKN